MTPRLRMALQSALRHGHDSARSESSSEHFDGDEASLYFAASGNAVRFTFFAIAVHYTPMFRFNASNAIQWIAAAGIIFSKFG